MERYLYMNKANRDAQFKALGGKAKGYRKTSIRNQQLHPQYVADYEQVTGRTLTAADKGFGNGIYDTMFSVLYRVESEYRAQPQTPTPATDAYRFRPVGE